jgi:hypothetical protein
MVSLVAAETTDTRATNISGDPLVERGVVTWFVAAETLPGRRIVTTTKSLEARVPVLPRANTIGSDGDGYSKNV